MFGGFKVSKPLAALTMVAAMAVSAGAVGAKGGPPAGESLGNNLSVPTHFIGAPLAAVRTACDGVIHEPIGPAVDGYYLQKTEAVWGAQCDSVEAADVTAQWGANLTNGRALKAGRPIRVEMALFAAGEAGLGYLVENLTPTLPDRQATYGIPEGATPYTFPDYLVYVPDATLTMEQVDGADPVTVPMTAEINSTGKVVYGYNWGIKNTGSPTAGTYLLTFTVPDLTATITGVAPGEVNNTTFTDVSTTVTIEITGGGGGGGSGNGGKG